MKRIISMFLLAGLVVFAAGSARAQAKQSSPAPQPSAGMVAEFLQTWNSTGQRLIEMAQDFPEDKFDFKPKPEVRTFAEQLLHAAGANYFFIAAATGTEPPADAEGPSRETYKTRTQVVEYIKKSFADGAAVIRQQGDKGMMETGKSPFGNRMMTHASLWLSAMNHANEHYGQCVVYYRINGIVPPASRRGN